MTKPDRSQDMAARGRIGGFALRATHDPRLYTAAARCAFLSKFWPSDPTLPPDEARKRAEAGLRAHMARLARLSAKKRTARRAKPKPLEPPASIVEEVTNE